MHDIQDYFYFLSMDYCESGTPLGCREMLLLYYLIQPEHSPCYVQALDSWPCTHGEVMLVSLVYIISILSLKVIGSYNQYFLETETGFQNTVYNNIKEKESAQGYLNKKMQV